MKDRSGFNLTRWSVNNSAAVIALYLSLLVCAVGVVGWVIPRRMMPYVRSPMIGVVTMMPGLAAQEMETYISKPIEERMTSISGVRFVRSTSQDGFSIVTLEFPYGQDMDAAIVSVQSLLNVIQGDLPATGANIKPSWVLNIDPLNIPVLTVALSGDATWSMPELRQLADNEITNRLKTATSDVYAVSVFGGYRRQLQVIVDRQQLAAYGLSILEVQKAIDMRNVARPAGTLTGNEREITVRVDTLAEDAETVADYPIRAVGDRMIYVKDVARVLDTFSERRSGYRHLHRTGEKVESRQALAVNILQNPEASSPLVIAAVRQELERLEADYPGIRFEVAYDNSSFVDILMVNMAEELVLAVILTGLAILFMMGEWRGTLIAMVSVPTCMGITILACVPLGLSLNSSTLIGLLLSIGRLVDDSVVDIHSIDRHLRMGKNPREATVDGITEVRMALAASAIMSVLGLTPLLFCGGVVQLMFEGLVWPLIVGQISSFFVSMTLTALLASRLMRKPEERQREMDRFPLLGIILGPFQAFLDQLERGYASAVSWLLKNRILGMIPVATVLIAGSGFYFFLGSEMMPLGDTGQAYMVLEMEPGTSYPATEKAARQLEDLLAKQPEIVDVSLEIGAEPMSSPYFTGYSVGFTNGATAMLTFADKGDRERSIWQIIDGVVAEAQSSIPGIRRLQIKEMGVDVMASSSAPIQLLVVGPDLAVLDKLGEEVGRIARETPGMYQVGTSWTLSQPALEIEVDPRRAAEVGMTADEVAQQAYYSLRGGYTNEFYRLPNRRQTTILVRYEEPQRQPGPEDLEQMTIITPEGPVTLSTLARVVPSRQPSLIEHDGMRRVKTVTGFYRLGGPYSMDLAMSVMMRSMSELNWPPGYSLEVRGDMTQMMDSFRRLLVGLQLSLVFIFFTLVAQFRGWLQPFQMMLSIPLELSGIFFFLWLNAQAFSTVSIMAVIVVTGMDAATAILLIEMIMQLREEGVPRDEAVVQACPTRLRPILITNTISILTMIPVAFFPGIGIDAYSPLASVVIGGLLMGTLLSLFVIPVMHVTIDDLVQAVARRRSGSKTSVGRKTP